MAERGLSPAKERLPAEPTPGLELSEQEAIRAFKRGMEWGRKYQGHTERCKGIGGGPAYRWVPEPDPSDDVILAELARRSGFPEGGTR